MFLLTKVKYLGHIIDESDVHPTQEKVKAGKEAPVPKNLAELRSFLGIINYYCRFLSNLSTRLAPLYALLKKGLCWCQKTTQHEAFQAAKRPFKLTCFINIMILLKNCFLLVTLHLTVWELF